MLEPAKTVEQTHVFDVLQNQRRESAVAGTDVSKGVSKNQKKENSVRDVFSSMAVSKRIFASSLTGKFCSRCFCFLQAKQNHVFVDVSRPTRGSPAADEVRRRVQPVVSILPFFQVDEEPLFSISTY